MVKITKEQALETIKKLFEFTKWEERTDKPFNFISEKDGVYSFGIDKRLVFRDEVVHRLYDAFSNADIEGYQIRISGIVLLYTMFYLEPRKHEL